jgi:hypothetical protein
MVREVIPDLHFFYIPEPDPGSRGQKSTGFQFRICNSGKKEMSGKLLKILQENKGQRADCFKWWIRSGQEFLALDWDLE